MLHYSFTSNTESPGTPFITPFMEVHPSGLTEEEITRIRDYGDSLETTSVKIYGRNPDEERVNAIGSHFPYNDETSWIYDRMSIVAQEINDLYFKYELSGFAENFYFMKYRSPAEHFNWHLDIGPAPAPRKLSLVLQLSTKIEFEGGEFEVMLPEGPVKAPKAQGLIMAFPSYVIHRVTPVTEGVRRTLTMFACGPDFK